MSTRAYHQLLVDTNLVLDKTLEQEQVFQQWAEQLKKIKNAREAHTTVFRLYATYVQIMNNLEQCYDQMLQPQKRVTIRVLLDASMGRVLELKEELVNLDLSDFNYDDDALTQLRLTPYSVDIRVPRYFIREREAERLERKKLMDDIYQRLHPPEPTQEETDQADEGKTQEENEEDEIDRMLKDESGDTEVVHKTAESVVTPPKESLAIEELPEEETTEVIVEEHPSGQDEKVTKVRETPQQRREKFAKRATDRKEARQKTNEEIREILMQNIQKAVFLIQVHERSRQARHRHQNILYVSSLQKPESQKRLSKEEQDRQEQEATKIQRYWRRHRLRQQQRIRIEKERKLLWTVPKGCSWDRTQRDRAEEVCCLRHEVQADYQEDFEDCQVRELEYYKEFKVLWLQEQYTDEIRDWFREWYVKAKNFPEFPKEEEGGSLLVAEKKVITPEEWMKEREKELAMKQRKSKQPSKAPPKETKEQKKERKKKEKELLEKIKREEEKRRIEDEKDNPGFKMSPSKYLPMLTTVTDHYNAVWRYKDESSNPEQRHYLDMIQEEKQLQVQQEVRRSIDMLMRLELEALKVALEKDVARMKGKKWRKKKEKKKRKQKRKKGKRKIKDLTEGRTTESLIEELMNAGILVHPVPEIRIEQFSGDCNYTAYEKRLLMEDPVPTVGDVRNLVLQYCILPLGSPLIRQTSPLTKAVCIVGPRDSGKHMMVNAICTETGAYLFDISPNTILGKYKGKEGTKMFDHLLNKMARLLQPSVIFIDGAEKPFYRKIPKEERHTEPKRLARWLTKFAKGIKPEDQVVIVGVTNQPWVASAGKMNKLYKKFIFIPCTDYGTTEAVWQGQLMRYHLVDTNFDTSALAKVTVGLPIGVIKYLVQKVLTRRRILQLPIKPLTPMEIFEASLNYDPVTEEELKKFLNWFSKRTKLGKKRATFLEEYHALQEKLQKMKKVK